MTPERLVQRSVQGFRREGKSYATVAVGCTGRPPPLGRDRQGAGPGRLARRTGIALIDRIAFRHRDIATVRLMMHGIRPAIVRVVRAATVQLR